MIKNILAIILLSIAIQVSAQHTVRFIITSLPQSKDSNFYAAGSFNKWNPKDEAYKFQRDAKGNYFLETKLSDGTHEFKITRGGWDKGESAKNGFPIGNRSFKLMNDTLINLAIQDWADRYPTKERKSTAGKNVHIIDTAFFMPQLNRTRRVWIYLPSDYATSKRKYPVLYMHDGQNIFDDLTSYVGEWGVDEFMDSINVKKACIVVAVDHGGTHRTSEYCPYDYNNKISGVTVQGKGEGDQYVDFLVKNLKPFIDKNYRTQTDRAHTYIAGSSMGGIISMYAVLKYPDVFGGAGVFSPAFWIGPKIFDDIKDKGNKVNAKIYFYAGGKESDRMVPDMVKAHNDLIQVSKKPQNYVSIIDDNAMHNEAAWRKQFPHFYLWLIGEERFEKKN